MIMNTRLSSKLPERSEEPIDNQRDFSTGKVFTGSFSRVKECRVTVGILLAVSTVSIFVPV